jgi:hypothetical protein
MVISRAFASEARRRRAERGTLRIRMSFMVPHGTTRYHTLSRGTPQARRSGRSGRYEAVPASRAAHGRGATSFKSPPARRHPSVPGFKKSNLRSIYSARQKAPTLADGDHAGKGLLAMCRRRRHDRVCRLCGQHTMRQRSLQMCFWTDEGWLWTNAMLCYPCCRALSDAFGSFEEFAQEAWW